MKPKKKEVPRVKLRKNFRSLLQFVSKLFKSKKGKGSYTRKEKRV